MLYSGIIIQKPNIKTPSMGCHLHRSQASVSIIILYMGKMRMALSPGYATLQDKHLCFRFGRMDSGKAANVTPLRMNW